MESNLVKCVFISSKPKHSIGEVFKKKFVVSNPFQLLSFSLVIFLFILNSFICSLINLFHIHKKVTFVYPG